VKAESLITCTCIYWIHASFWWPFARWTWISWNLHWFCFSTIFFSTISEKEPFRVFGEYIYRPNDFPVTEPTVSKPSRKLKALSPAREKSCTVLITESWDKDDALRLHWLCDTSSLCNTVNTHTRPDFWYLSYFLCRVSRDLELGGVPAVSPSTKKFFRFQWNLVCR